MSKIKQNYRVLYICDCHSTLYHSIKGSGSISSKAIFFFIFLIDLSSLILSVENISLLLVLSSLISAERFTHFSHIWVFLLLFTTIVNRANATSSCYSATLSGGARALCGIVSPGARWDGGSK